MSHRTRLRAPLVRLLFIALLAPASGCNSRGWKATYPVRGTVRFDGKPAAGARVVLYPVEDQGPRAVRPQGRVADDGAVVFSTYQSRDGAPAGEYTATVTLYRNDVPPSLLPQRYADPARSGLRVKVEERDNVLEPFELTP